MRDAITLFEQYSVGGVLKKKYIEENLELIGDEFLAHFTESLVIKNSEETLKNLTFLREKSLDVRLFLEQLLFFLRDRMKEALKKPNFREYAELFEIFEGIYGRLKFAPDPFLLLETSTFRCIASHTPLPYKESSVTEKKEVKEIKTSVVPIKKQEENNIPSTPTEEEKPTSSFDFSRFIEHIRTVPKRSFI